MSWQNTVSAWDWKKGRWDHYRLPPWARPGWSDLPVQPTLGATPSPLGETPEESALPCPAGVTYAGSSDRAEGQIVQPPGRAVVKWIALGLGGFFLWRALRRA
jgi:hypothetical protein